MTMLCDGMLMGAGGASFEIVGSWSAAGASIAVPAGLHPGDHLLLLFGTIGGAGTVAASGFAKLLESLDTAFSAPDMYCFYKQFAGEAGSYTVSNATGARVCVLIAIRGAVAFEFGSVGRVGTDTSTTLTAPSFAATKPGMLYSWYLTHSSVTVSTPPAGMTMVQSLSGEAGIAARLYGLADLAAGATGNRTIITNIDDYRRAALNFVAVHP